MLTSAVEMAMSSSLMEPALMESRMPLWIRNAYERAWVGVGVGVSGEKERERERKRERERRRGKEREERAPVRTLRMTSWRVRRPFSRGILSFRCCCGGRKQSV